MKKLLFFFLILFSLHAFADVRLPAIISDHMVLQQNITVKIWGWCDPTEKIKINTNWDTSTYIGTGGSDAKWNVAIKTP
jgi:sialate O-acetylesterase